MKNILKFIFFVTILTTTSFGLIASEQSQKLLNPGWSFKGFFGKFDRSSLQRGYQVYNEVCASCHSLKYLSYRNLAEKGGPEFSEDEASKQDGGMLGDLHSDTTLPEIAAVMVKLSEGETSNIFQSPFGYHILKLDEIIPSTLIPFEEAQSDILNMLMKRETQSLFKKYLIDLENSAKVEIFI